jgi:asparagine synthase (glutamine-hydrolysing)
VPGIVGIISRTRPDERELGGQVDEMLAVMRHELSYVSGKYESPEMGIYVGWIAHEGSFASKQIFQNEHSDVVLVFSGECFLDSETCALLCRAGYAVDRMGGDWLVHLYEEKGEQAFQDLNGLFSGLLIDKRGGQAFLFNDRYGVERLYWHESNDAFYFASEAKALLRVLPELRQFDTEGVAQFLTFGYTVGERTLFRGVQLFPPGSLWVFEHGNCHRRRYFSPECWEAQPTLSPENFEWQFRETFKRILPRYFESESRIGISLTAGLDSRMIMACLPETAERPVCYTFSGQDCDTLDTRVAARVAANCGLGHEVLRLGSDFLSNFASHGDRTVYLTDGSLGILGSHEIYLNRQARALAPVRLTGVFGGEILRGVTFLKPLHLSPELLSPGFLPCMRAVKEDGMYNDPHPVTAAAFREIPEKRFGPPAVSRSQLVFRTPFLDNEIVSLAYQMPEAARKSPSAALHLVKANNSSLAHIPTDRGLNDDDKSLQGRVRRLFGEVSFKLDYLSSEGLPRPLSGMDPLFRRLNSAAGILGLHKFLSYRSWFRRELATYVDEVLHCVETRGSPFWNSGFVRNLGREHSENRKNYMREINAVLTLEAVERLLFTDLSRSREVSAMSGGSVARASGARARE